MPASDALRSARLHFYDELADGVISVAELESRPNLLRVFASRPVPNAGLRAGQRLAMKARRLDFESGFLAKVMRARREVLGGFRAAAAPKFLIRVDEFPDAAAFDHSERGLAASKVFHETLAAAGVPYLMAIVPQYTHRPLDPSASGGRPLDSEDKAFIEQMRSAGVTFAQHGTTHRTRYATPARRSELVGLEAEPLERLISDGLDRLAAIDVHPRVFVPPFNRFSADQLPILARHFTVVGGGPESVRLLGFRGGPLWWGQSVFLPSYTPLYGSAYELLSAVDRIVALAPGTWIPIVLHSAWEVGDQFAALRRLAHKCVPYAASWESFLAACDATKAPTGTRSRE